MRAIFSAPRRPAQRCAIGPLTVFPAPAATNTAFGALAAAPTVPGRRPRESTTGLEDVHAPPRLLWRLCDTELRAASNDGSLGERTVKEHARRQHESTGVSWCRPSSAGPATIVARQVVSAVLETPRLVDSISLTWPRFGTRSR